jgi:hypothetical protein
MSSGDGESKSKSRIKYKPDMELALAKIISQTKANKKDDNKKVAEKTAIVEKLAAEHELFKDYRPTGEALMTHLKKMCTSFRAKAGVDMEGANLSAIAKEPDELELLLANMIEDAENTEKLKQDEKLKKTKLAKQLARIEAAGLGHQGRINTLDSILDTKDDSDGGDDCDDCYENGT